MIRVCHVITTLDVGGAEMMLWKLLSRLDRTQFEPSVVCLTEVGPLGAAIGQLGIPVESLRMQRGGASLAGIWRLYATLRRRPADILQTWLYHADLLGLIGGALARVPVILWNLRTSSMDMRHYRRLSAWTVRACALLSGYPNAVVVNSEFGREHHSRLRYCPKRWVTIPNGFDLAHFKPDAVARTVVRRQLGLPADAPLIGLVARFDPVKDHATFLRAAGVVATSRPDVHFLLVGPGVTGDNPALARLIDEVDLRGRAHLLGARSDMARLTAALDVAVLSSAYGEGFPNAVGEAMACGVPCVVTDVGDAARIVGDTGVVVPPKDPTALAAAWFQLLCMGEARLKKLGEVARQRVASYYNLDAIAHAYEDLYLSLAPPSADSNRPAE